MDFILKITGVEPILMHNARLSDEFDPITLLMKKITAKRTNKTEDDRLELRRLEFLGSLYIDEVEGPFIPGQNIERALVDAGKVTRQGTNVQRGVQIVSNINPLAYTGPRDAEKLWEDKQFVHAASVKVGTSRIIRTRPVFREWSLEATGTLDTEIMDLETLTGIAYKAGANIGLGDWRPRFGRFDVEVVS